MCESITVVTGASGGIGAEAARLWEREHPGDLLLRTDVRLPGEIDPAAGDHSRGPDSPGGAAAQKPWWIHCDISEEDEVTELFHQISSHGLLARVIHVAGVFTNKELVETESPDFDRIMGVNARGGFFLLREAARLFRDQTPRYGRETDRSITVVASNASGTPRWGMSAYGASKAALSQLTRTAGLELAQYGVRCNVLCPGATETSMQRAFWGADPKAGRERSVRGDLAIGRLGIPLGRMGSPGDVASAAVFLASPAARYVNLQELYVDGGATQHA